MSSIPAYILPLLLPLTIVLHGCGNQPGEIRDLATLSQDCNSYVDAQSPGALWGPNQRLNEEFRRQWYRPWHPKPSTPALRDVAQPFANIEKRPGYGANYQPVPASFVNALRENADLAGYPNKGYKAICTRNTNLRQLPTLWPRFEMIDKAGEGFPFDSLQESALWAGNPLLVCHASADGQWLYVDASCGPGWVQAQDVATMDDDAIDAYRKSRQAALIKDNVSVADSTGAWLFSTHIGAVFPLVNETADDVEVLVPARNADGKAVIRHATLGKAQAAAIPLPPTQANVAKVANEMIGQLYGWGGMYEGRDCSATTRDLMTPFGVWLPRNSGAQAAAFRSVSLKDLSGEAKERAIIAKGVPFATLLRMPGHVALYLGTHRGRAIMLQNFWGIKTRKGGVEGRRIVGRCAITTLQPGIELSDIDLPQGDMRNRTESMIFIGVAKDGSKSAP